jgi:hypothetical protein
MNGVEILSSIEVVAESAYNITAFWTVFLIDIIATAIICACIWANEGFSGAIIVMACAGVLMGSFVGGAAGIGCATPASYVTEYNVTISDEVSMNEFLDKYEILDQEGKIYTVKERE